MTNLWWNTKFRKDYLKSIQVVIPPTQTKAQRNIEKEAKRAAKEAAKKK